MPDDLDDLDPVLRRAMASLDGEVPAGYFDALPDRALARLDDPAIGGPIAALRDDDAVAELDDIRSLASETRARLSSQRAAQGSPLGAADDAAATSGVWKAVALPEPGKQVLARAGAASPVGAAESIAAPGRARRGRRTQLAVAGLGLAAAAGAVIALTTVREADRAAPAAISAESPRSASGAGSAAAPPIIAHPPPAVTPPSPHAAAPARPSSAGGGTTEGDFATDPKPAADPGVAVSGKRSGDAKSSKPSKKGSGRLASSTKADGSPPKAADPTANRGAVRAADKPGTDKPSADKPSAGPPTATDGGKVEGAFQVGPGTGSGTGSGREPSLDELLGEPSTPAPRTKAPRLERTSLSADDFKRGMTAIDAKARACFAGTQGLASLRLTVAPSGRVASATVTGMFAGSPVGGCVERAVRAAKFPPWDGRPQRFSYSYLLSD